MKELKNNVDYESTFCDLQKAKHYYIPKEDKPCEIEDYLGTDYENYCLQWNEYKKELKAANNLEEFAEVLNKYTDIFSDGRTHIVNDI